ncbi:MAG: L,D-transpeptidase family protein [Acidobacteriia bacterium]|nr:L,D-transpeptidase family protein [Terriglobia bacterium]
MVLPYNSRVRSRYLRATVAFVVAILSAAIVVAKFHAQPLPQDARADRVLVLKSERTLTLYDGNTPLKTYLVALGRNPVGKKAQQGDHKTPEGNYILDRHNPQSRFYRSIDVSYPTPDQIADARQHGASPGGDIFIHGLPNGLGWLGRPHRRIDWTDGCIAVTDREMDEIWRAVPDGTPIEIRP